MSGRRPFRQRCPSLRERCGNADEGTLPSAARAYCRCSANEPYPMKRRLTRGTAPHRRLKRPLLEITGSQMSKSFSLAVAAVPARAETRPPDRPNGSHPHLRQDRSRRTRHLRAARDVVPRRTKSSPGIRDPDPSGRESGRAGAADSVTFGGDAFPGNRPALATNTALCEPQTKPVAHAREQHPRPPARRAHVASPIDRAARVRARCTKPRNPLAK